jgi:predicted AlkP superfamily pyrophosphatase or phosphodiesterase
MKIALSVAALLVLAPVAAPCQRTEPAKPRLVVAISVDQLSADLFAEYRPHFRAGLRRLAEGIVFPSGFQSHSATETCPGHATILTGARPARSGIIANYWYDQGVAREDKLIYCAEDENVPGSSSKAFTVSNVHLRVPALGDLMKAADHRSRVAAVAGKDRAAVMMGGRDPDQVWWWSDDGFTGLGTPGAAVAAVNANVKLALSKPREPLDSPPQCLQRSRPVAVQGGTRPVGDQRFARAADDKRAFRANPEFDGAVLALAAGLRDEMRLGEGEAPDLLILGLSATDYVGHTYGSQGGEMCLQLLALDRELGDFFDHLDGRGIDYLVMLTSDHGGEDIPERSRQNGAPQAARVDSALLASNMGKVIGARLKLPGPVLFSDAAAGDFYVDRSLAPAQRDRALEAAVAAYRAHPQVASVITAKELRAAAAPSGPPDSWSLIDRAKASFDPTRSGDFLVQLRPGVSVLSDASSGYAASHGSPWDYDRRVPILFWRKGITPFEQPLAVETVDIMPTLAAVLGIAVPPSSIDGRCLDLIEGLGTSCP